MLGGFRYLGLDTKTDWKLTATVSGNGPQGTTVTVPRSGSNSDKETLWSAIFGAQGRVYFGDSLWFATAISTWAADLLSSPGRGSPVSATASSGATCCSITATCITAKATTS